MLLENEPLIFNNSISWPILNWSLNDWESQLNDELLTFRGNKFIKSKNPIWEKSCTTQRMRMKDFIDFQSKENTNWIYFDYKPMDIYFEGNDIIFESIKWDDFGFPDKNGKDTTIWIGSKGAHTPCHKDTYGYNLIAQLYGRKRWIIFPPEENLHPTRIPFEESSIYSKLNFFYPDLNEFNGISNARSVILNPGDVLYLPSGWWHYVENLETAISVNMWIKLPQDNRKRIEEGMVQLFMSKILSDCDKTSQDSILNPNSEFILENSVKDYIHLIKLHSEQHKNKKQKSETKNPSNPAQISKENSEIVPKLSHEDFMLLLKEQTTKYSFVEDTKNSNQHDEFLERVINAFCHPDIIEQIVDKIVQN